MCCTGNSPVLHALIPSIKSSFLRLLLFCASLSWAVPSLPSALYETSVLLSMDTVFWIPFSSTMTMSGISDNILNGRESLAVVLCAKRSPGALMPLFARVVCQQIRLVQSRVV